METGLVAVLSHRKNAFWFSFCFFLNRFSVLLLLCLFVFAIQMEEKKK